MEGPFLKWAPWWAMTRNGQEEKEKDEERPMVDKGVQDKGLGGWTLDTHLK